MTGTVDETFVSQLLKAEVFKSGASELVAPIQSRRLAGSRYCRPVRIPRVMIGLAAMMVAVALHGSPAWGQTNATGSRDPYSASVDLAPRLQWNANYGYCGETSFISAGMYFGQYTSQWTARDLASGGMKQTAEESQLLLGVNDLAAADRMRLEAVAFDSESQESVAEYLTWIKSMIMREKPVIIGVLMRLDEADSTYPGSWEYDHIVPVLAVASKARMRPGERRYRPTDALIISDNSGLTSESLYRLPFASSQRSRSAANASEAPAYSLRNRPMNYATTVLGVRDADGVTIPVRLTGSLDGEGVQDETWLTAQPAGRPLELTATVSIPDPGQEYRVYLYDDFDKVPIRGFNAAADQAIASWTIPAGSGPTWSTTISTSSDRTSVFRAVPVTAP